VSVDLDSGIEPRGCDLAVSMRHNGPFLTDQRLERYVFHP